jgi:DNA-binding beta-propeller fold protein YncE
MARLPRFLMLVAIVLVLASALVAQKSPQYRVTQHYKLDGDGGWDYVTYDPDGNRLFIARSTRVMVVDAASGKLLSEIQDTPGVHGIALASHTGRGYISAGRSGQVIAFDLKTLAKTGEVKAGDNPDAIIYDDPTGRVVVMNGRSKDVTFIDREKFTVDSTVPVGGKPEFAVSDGHGHVYVNIEDTGEVVALNPQKRSIVARWKLPMCDEPTGLAFDESAHRLFSVCSGNKTMFISDADNHKALATVQIGTGSDGVVYDPDTHLVISSNGEGTLTVVQQKSPDKYEVVQTLPTAPGARTLALDPKSHKVFLVTAQYGPAPAASADQPRPRPPILPGTFEVIVCELEK